jgi:signal transduction histidine kinase
MGFRIHRTASTGPSQRLWPVLAMLILIVALPTAGVLWFMNRAMQNERAAVRERLTEAYRSQLEAAAGRVQAAWDTKPASLVQMPPDERGSAAFAQLVKSGIADSVLFFENGRLYYPDLDTVSSVASEPKTQAWLEASRLEYEKNSPKAAAEAYGKIASRSERIRESALAFLAQARCLNKAGWPQAAIELLTDTLGGARFHNIADTQGRLLQPNAVLFALQLMKNPSHAPFTKTAQGLADRLNEYGDSTMPSSQRRFLMQQLQLLWQECPPFPTLEAEEIAAAFWETDLTYIKSDQLQQMPNQAIWSYQTTDKSATALFRQDHLLAFLNSAIGERQPISGVRISAHAPGTASTELFLNREIGGVFPDWNLTLNLEDPDPFESASSQNITTYFWIGILMMAAIIMLSVLMAGYLRRQIRLARLKNDLIATVSHELKTPLASMRLLVDTLRDGHYGDIQLVQEYLQMISKENARLSSLIEGFLTFSRMERKKTKFDRSLLQPKEIVEAALEAVGDRLQAPGCTLDLDVEPEMPSIIGDRDAMITVLVNLLDNALKYSGEEKKIRLRGYSSNGSVYLEVQDNGIGFPRSASKKIFDRFYQVDRTLSRSTGGCGLGLSIVEFIIAAHNGSVTAKSQPGRGSSFTVQLPAA